MGGPVRRIELAPKVYVDSPARGSQPSEDMCCERYSIQPDALREMREEHEGDLMVVKYFQFALLCPSHLVRNASCDDRYVPGPAIGFSVGHPLSERDKFESRRL